jgi:SAM-dependent methyltransferase
VFRALSGDGLADWRALKESPLFERIVGDGRLVATEEVEGSNAPDVLSEGTEGVLKHERIPFVSYPYEWPASMLRDAALLQLDLLQASLGDGLILKDSSPYNVQWRGAQPVFVDVGSFEKLREGEPWIGYRQFCMLFLYPLMLRVYKDVSYQPFLRGRLDGITPSEADALLRGKGARFRKGIFSHVRLHAKLERRNENRQSDVKKEMRKAGFKKELIVANVARMRKLVEGLEWKLPQGVWVEYGANETGQTYTYTDDDAGRKDDFVRGVVQTKPWKLAWDVGCNNGRYSRIAAENADQVVALDADEGISEALYRSLRDEGNTKILPLVMNATDPSPNLGWRGSERTQLERRGKPDLVLCLALLHHVSITGNVPVREFVDWLAGLGAEVVIEFMTREDPMVKRLLAAKREGLHRDYERGFFERTLGEAFEITRTEELGSGTRVLYHARPRGGRSLQP